nr:hypothetical protein [Paraburkholderia unamae]
MFVAYSCEPFTASVLDALTSPAATFVSVTVELAPVPPSVTEACADESYITASASWPLIDVIWPLMFVTSPAMFETFVFVAYSCEPFTASVLDALTSPAATFVSFTAELASEPPSVTVPCADESYITASASWPLMLVIWPLISVMPWFVAYSCEPFTASVLDALRTPAATFVSFTAELAPVPPSVTEECADESYITASAS